MDKVKTLAARDSHVLLNNFLIKHFGVLTFPPKTQGNHPELSCYSGHGGAPASQVRAGQQNLHPA